MAAIAHCPMCHTANDDRAAKCDRCGYEFGQSPEALRGMLQTQLHTSVITFVVLLVLDLALLPLIVLIAGFGILGIGALFGFLVAVKATFTAARKISVSRHSLKLIANKQLPKAQVHSK